MTRGTTGGIEGNVMVILPDSAYIMMNGANVLRGLTREIRAYVYPLRRNIFGAAMDMRRRHQHGNLRIETNIALDPSREPCFEETIGETHIIIRWITSRLRTTSVVLVERIPCRYRGPNIRFRPKLGVIGINKWKST